MNTQDFHYTFSEVAQNEVYDFIKNSTGNYPAFKSELETVRTKLEGDQKIVIVKPFDDLHTKYTIPEQRLITWLIGNELGEPLVQNETGDKVVCVYERDRNNSMATGARYHQTREGGTIHTDNVNVPFHWEYMVLTCITPAMTGGENILVNGNTIHKILKENYPDVLATLEKNFIWEQRGVADATYEAPIITYAENGEPLFRHLRPYMESAHNKTGHPLTDEQVFAIDTLDALIEHSDNQYRYTFKAGEILLTYDSQVLHGRTRFTDAPGAVTIHDWIQDPSKPMKRTMDRIWVKRKV